MPARHFMSAADGTNVLISGVSECVFNVSEPVVVQVESGRFMYSAESAVWQGYPQFPTGRR